ncbi:hypothetical protein KS4_26060 [Poriferisphaera corsica]|uniref:Glucose-1-phosphate adenylyltransferase/Bifunctional protein GlmU-like C-terminal hexapeptide domain-containing protein n=1 Tax=Poriferisphaera corsica TaxID=2528020 RepID=A0A517YWD9_9BACT|nr:hypothetical protein [Poriferisphaera corsica]QDU34536.1 hypothetical protein KS4_26060 [Poriferisphaera corsica]
MSKCTSKNECIKAAIVLAGSVRATDLRKKTTKNFLDLPVSEDETIITRFVLMLSNAFDSLGQPDAILRFILDRGSPRIKSDLTSVANFAIQFDFDPNEFRGTGGILRDISEEYDDEDLLLIMNASQIMVGSVKDLISEMIVANSDVVIASQKDDTPLDVILIRAKVLKDINKVGFVDFKEQALPKIVLKRDVKVHRSDCLRTYPVRTLNNYIDAIKLLNGHIVTGTKLNDEDWMPLFSIIESGANVHSTAQIHDSVILRGANVSEHAVIVRSLITSTGIVKPKQSVVDTIIV